MSADQARPALYPPTITPPDQLLGVFAFLNAFVRNPLRVLPRGCYEAPITIAETPRRQLVWITDPALIETVLLEEAEGYPKAPEIEDRIFSPALGHGLLTADGQAWRRQRKAAAPAFLNSELMAAVPAMAAAAEALAKRWRARGARYVRDVEHDMTDVTFDVIAATVLGGCDEATAELIKSSVDAYLGPIAWDLAFGILELPRWLWYPRRGRQRRSAARIRTELGKIISSRRANAEAHDDLLARLMSARGAEDGAAMSEPELVDNLATFLVAGHETTAKALTWTLYLLARAPEWQERIRAEVAAVAGDRTITAGDLDRLAITEMVLKESMRLYPPAPVMSRQAAADGMLGGHAINRNALITIPIYAMHRHRLLWDDPDRFDPERFAPAASGKLNRTQFMPFGFGPRTCIGSVFAMIEAKVLLATFVRAARFGWDGRHAPEPVSRVTLRPKGGMPLAVEPIGAGAA